MYLHQLPYCSNSNRFFENLASLPFAVCLDSNIDKTKIGQFDIMSASPEVILRVSQGQGYRIEHQKEVQLSVQETLNYLDTLIAEQKQITEKIKTTAKMHQLPFWGGIIGLLSYDFARYIEKLPTQSQADVNFPELLVGLYSWAIISDHANQQTFFISYLSEAEAKPIYEKIKEKCAQPQQPTPFKLKNKFTSNMHYASYQQKLSVILQQIYDGECYEVNFAQRFNARYTGSTFDLHRYLKQHNPAPFSAYMHTPYGDIISCSPEKFLQINHGIIETKPIKGTRPRGKTTQEDQELAAILLHSEKDHAENLMIVDLMRNDLSKICQPHSIHVTKLCHLESFSNVHHLVSTIDGQLNPQTTLTDIILATFPGGSITGAPKVRAMEIIDELEPHRRNVYCGSLFHYDIRGEMNSNILIRTLLCQKGNAYLYGGGAIVMDSNIEEEYRESLAKVSNIISLLETK